MEAVDLLREYTHGSHRFQGVDLIDADLSDTVLVGADLTFADLSGANLDRATLVNCDLCGVDLAGASLRGTTLVDCEITGALDDIDTSRMNLIRVRDFGGG